MPTRKRTISYLRAGWKRHNQPEGRNAASLEDILSRCLDRMTSVESTTFDFKGGKAAIRHRQKNKDGLYLHVVTWTEDENASTVRHDNTKVNNADLGTAPPGSKWDYLDGDGMVLLSGNHCLILPIGLRREAVEKYLQDLIGHAPRDIFIPATASAFRLVPIVRPDLAKKISDEGIKKIRFPTLGQYWQTAHERSDGQDERLQGNIVQRTAAGLLGLLATKASDRLRIEKADNVLAELVVSLDSRRPGLAPEDLSEILSEDISEVANEIEIETRLGSKFKRGNLVLTRLVDILTRDKTEEYQAAWEEMGKYLRDLRTSGRLEL